jgi:hypothetical protein
MDNEKLAKFEQEAEIAQGKERRLTHHVHHHIPPEAFFLITGVISLISVITWLAWVFNHPSDFISTSSVLVHGGIWMLTAGAMIGLTWLAIKVIILPLVEVGHRIVDAIGKVKRHRVHAAMAWDGAKKRLSRRYSTVRRAGPKPGKMVRPSMMQL